MRLLPELRTRWLVGCVIMLLQCAALPARAAGEPPSDEPPSDAAVARAIETLRTDPNLLKEQRARRLRWRQETEPEAALQMEADSSTQGFDIVAWLARLGRVLMWLTVATLLVGIGITLLRHASRWRRATPPPASLPTHVRDLDIRPEGLPKDIGAAALELWQRGDQRACLALLYRGLLSRLVHVYAVPITASSTEGDCMLLARAHLPGPSQSYAQQLVQVWQFAVYGARDPDDAVVRALCADFASVLPSATGRPPS